jgi:hypothetical protein
MKCLLHITMTIYDPGYQTTSEIVDSKYSEYFERHDLWLTPIRHKKQWGHDEYDPLDCIREKSRDQWGYDAYFDKWAVGFDFRDLPIGISAGFEAARGLMGEEFSNMGQDWLTDYLWDIVELFDPIITSSLPIDQPYGRGTTLAKVHTLSGITVWDFHWFRCNAPFDGEEWDCTITLEKLLPLSVEAFETLNSHKRT